MKKFKSVLLRISRIKALKYVVVTLVAVIVVGFVDENSVWNHMRNRQRISELQQEIKVYEARYRHDQNQLRMLSSNPKAIEKIARERYFMKADDEDIFVLSDDQQQTSFVEYETVE